MSDISKKNGLLYTDDFKTLVGVDSESQEFKGRVPFGPKQIGDKAFAGVNYESISLADSVKVVGFNLFENAAGVKSIKLPSALSELTPHMFDGCSSLEKVKMPNIVTEFPEYLFNGCSSLTEIPFRTDITYIGIGACQGCASVKSLAFPDTVQTVESQAFANCTGLESVVIGANVAEIADDAFAGCNSVKRIRVDESNPNFYVGDDDCLYRKSDNKLLIKIAGVQSEGVNFFSASDSLTEGIGKSENPADNPVWIDEVDSDEEDDTFSATISMGDDEEISVGADSEEINAVEPDMNISDNTQQEETNMEQSDDMLAGIMEQNTSTENVDSSVAVNLDELAGVVSAMNDTNGIYTEDQAKSKKMEKNLSILCNAVEYSYIQDFSNGSSVGGKTLYVIVEKLVQGSSGNSKVSDGLMKCCNKLVKIHGFNRVVYFSGLPFDNDEFVDFLTNMLNLQNVLVACDASSPSKLSENFRQACMIGGISLDKDEMAEQKKQAGVTGAAVLKLVVQDKY